MNAMGMDLNAITTFLGWCAAINVGTMVLAFSVLIGLGDWVVKIRAQLFKIDEATVRKAHFQFFLAYAIALIHLNLVPYIALKILT